MHSETWTFVDGRWLDGNPGLTGPRSHAFWLASSVFDGARYFEGSASTAPHWRSG
jgi:branched-chain amino acid aminotransferase